MTPLVSVCMITYNHETFIRTAIESVINQQTDFPFELVIGEDCSTDSTRAIAEEYAEKYPHIVRLLPSDRNYGANPNYIRTYKACKGKYVAIIEGDDSWNALDKLQQQFTFMESNPDYSMVCHNATIHNHIKGETYIFQNIPTRDFSFKDTLNKHLCPTASKFMRRSCFTPPDFMAKAKAGDQIVCQILAMNGKIRYWNKIMSIYNIHAQGASVVDGKTIERTLCNRIEMLNQLDLFSEYKLSGDIKDAIKKIKLRIWYVKNVSLLDAPLYKWMISGLYRLRLKFV